MTCTLCNLEMSTTNIAVFDCGHSFHLSCVFHQNFKTTCSICEQDVSLLPDLGGDREIAIGADVEARVRRRQWSAEDPGRGERRGRRERGHPHHRGSAPSRVGKGRTRDEHDAGGAAKLAEGAASDRQRRAFGRLAGDRQAAETREVGAGTTREPEGRDVR